MKTLDGATALAKQVAALRSRRDELTARIAAAEKAAADSHAAAVSAVAVSGGRDIAAARSSRRDAAEDVALLRDALQALEREVEQAELEVRTAHQAEADEEYADAASHLVRTIHRTHEALVAMLEEHAAGLIAEHDAAYTRLEVAARRKSPGQHLGTPHAVLRTALQYPQVGRLVRELRAYERSASAEYGNHVTEAV